MVDKFHANLKAKGSGAKGWANSWTEVEHLGDGRFASSISVGHRVFKDKADGQWKKRKLTDAHPVKDYVLIQGVKCCVEVYPYYAKYFDVQHEEVQVDEERWVVQRLFKEPDVWRDVGAWSPVMTVEEGSNFIKVTVTYETDYGPFTVEYFQRDCSTLKHNVYFKNTSGETETFRVLQRWSGIVGNKVKTMGKKHTITEKTILDGSVFTFVDEDNLFKIHENALGIGKELIGDILEMFTGSREIDGEQILVDEGGLKVVACDRDVEMILDGRSVIKAGLGSISLMIPIAKQSPENARVFLGSLDLGIMLFPLANSHKTLEVIVCEDDERVFNFVAPLVLEYFNKHRPNFNLQIVHGNLPTEVVRLGKFDMIFIGGTYWADGIDFSDICKSNLTEGGKYSDWIEVESPLAAGEFKQLYLDPVEIDVHAQGLKADFIYSNWSLNTNEVLKIDPDTATLNDPTIDGDISFIGSVYGRDTSTVDIKIGKETHGPAQPCFTADTQILMSDGSYKQAGKIKVGDTVKYYDFKKAMLLDTKITEIFSRVTNKLIVLNGRLKVTPNHILITPNETFVVANELKIGDLIQGKEGPIQITSIEEEYTKTKVLDINTESTYLFTEDFLTLDGYWIHRGFVEWDVSGIDNSATITDTVFKYNGRSWEIDCHVHEMLGVQPSTEDDDAAGNQAIYDEAGEGTVYVDPAGFPVADINQSIDLGAAADSDLEDQLALDWFAIGFQSDDEAQGDHSFIYAEESAGTPDPTLYVVYTAAEEFFKILTETLSLGDALTRIFSSHRIFSEAPTLTDSLARIFSSHRTFAETSSLSDTLQRQLALQRILSETITLGDIGLAIIKEYFAILAETLTLSDTLTRILALQRILTEAVTTDDTLVSQLALYRILTETSSLSDNISKGMTLAALTEAVSTSDSILKGLGKMLTESVTTGDTLVRQLALYKILTETATLGDVLLRQLTLYKILTETVTSSDTLLRILALQRIFTETITLDDTILRTLTLQRILSEAVTLDDTVTAIKIVVKILTETMALSDTFLRTITLHRILTETGTLTDTLLKEWAIQKILTETIAPSDNILKVIQKLLTETIAPSDTLIRQMDLYRILTETPALSDIFLRQLVLYRGLTENIIASDTLTRRLSLYRILWERPSEGNWLSDWDKRVKITLDHNDIDAALSNFPILVYLSTSSGRDSDDVSFVFDELGNDANRKKIAITKADGITQCYVEIEKWVDADEEAWLWVKVPDVDPDVDTELYLYYDSSQVDNDAYVGDPSDAVVHNVWDAGFILVSHMRDDPDNEHIGDSTVYASNGTKTAANEPIEAAGKISKAQEFDGVNDNIAGVLTAGGVGSGDFTIEHWVQYSSFYNYISVFSTPRSVTGFNFGTQSQAQLVWYVQWLGEILRGAGTNFEADTWYYVVYTRSGGTLKCYIDLVEKDSAENIINYSQTDFHIGSLDGVGEYLTGLVDELRISKGIARTPAWIKASYESERDHLNDFGEEEVPAGIGLSDTLTRQMDLHRILSESVATDDSLVRLINFYRILTDTTTLDDTIVRQMDLFRILAETATISDTYAHIWDIYKIFTEAATLTDNILKRTTKAPFIESVSLTDSIIKGMVKAPLTEIITLADLISKGVSTTFTETITATDTLTRQMDLYKILTESVATSDTLTWQMDLYRILSETVAMGDTLARLINFYKILTDTATLDDTLVRQMDLFRILTDIVTLNDTVTAIRVLVKILTETITISDTLLRQLSLYKILTEAVTISDTLIRQMDLYRIFTETATMTDTLTRIATFFRIFPETVTATDILTRQFQMVKVLTETIHLWDIIHGVGKDIVATVELSLYTKKMVLTVFEKKHDLNLHTKKAILDVFKKTHELAFPAKRAILKRRV